MSSPLPWRATDIARAFVRGDVSAVEVTRDALRRITRVNPALHALLTTDADRALERAAALDLAPDRSALGPLAGVPVAIKDNICTAGLATTAGSRMLAGYVPPYSATAVDRLERAGAIVIGKANCDEFAMGSSNEHSAFGPACNPWDLARTPGGSSGGSAAAVAARLVPVALGSDTGGSVRQPAGFCGVVGLRPTYGRVSRYGLLSFASSMDQIGVLSLSIQDCAAVASAIAGRDTRDATSSSERVPEWMAAVSPDAAGLRIGVPRAWLSRGIDGHVANAFAAALEVWRERGAALIDVELPAADAAIPVYYVLATAEASSNLARYDGVRYGHRTAAPASLLEMYERSRDEGFGPEVKRRIMLGTFVLSAGYFDAFYVKAQQVRQAITAELEQALAVCDVLATPTSPTTAFKLGDRLNDPLQMYLADVFTVGASLAGLPALSVPGGYGGDGLPIGLQLIGRRFDEATLFRIGSVYERATRWNDVTRPSVCAE